MKRTTAPQQGEVTSLTTLLREGMSRTMKQPGLVPGESSWPETDTGIRIGEGSPRVVETTGTGRVGGSEEGKFMVSPGLDVGVHSQGEDRDRGLTISDPSGNTESRVQAASERKGGPDDHRERDPGGIVASPLARGPDSLPCASVTGDAGRGVEEFQVQSGADAVAKNADGRRQRHEYDPPYTPKSDLDVMVALEREYTGSLTPEILVQYGLHPDLMGAAPVVGEGAHSVGEEISAMVPPVGLSLVKSPSERVHGKGSETVRQEGGVTARGRSTSDDAARGRDASGVAERRQMPVYAARVRGASGAVVGGQQLTQGSDDAARVRGASGAVVGGQQLTQGSDDAARVRGASGAVVGGQQPTQGSDNAARGRGVSGVADGRQMLDDAARGRGASGAADGRQTSMYASRDRGVSGMIEDRQMQKLGSVGIKLEGKSRQQATGSMAGTTVGPTGFAGGQRETAGALGSLATLDRCAVAGRTYPVKPELVKLEEYEMADRRKTLPWQGSPGTSVVAVGRKPLTDINHELSWQMGARFEGDEENRHSEHIIQKLVDGGEDSTRVTIRVMELGLVRALPCHGHALHPGQPHHGPGAFTNKIALSTKEQGGCPEKNCSEYNGIAIKELGGIFQSCPGCHYRGAQTDPAAKGQMRERKLRNSKCCFCGKRPETTGKGANSPSSVTTFATPQEERMITRSAIRDAIFEQLEDELPTEQARQRAFVEVSIQCSEAIVAMERRNILRAAQSFLVLPNERLAVLARLESYADENAIESMLESPHSREGLAVAQDIRARAFEHLIKKSGAAVGMLNQRTGILALVGKTSPTELLNMMEARSKARVVCERREAQRLTRPPSTPELKRLVQEGAKAPSSKLTTAAVQGLVGSGRKVGGTSVASKSSRVSLSDCRTPAQGFEAFVTWHTEKFGMPPEEGAERQQVPKPPSETPIRRRPGRRVAESGSRGAQNRFSPLSDSEEEDKSVSSEDESAESGSASETESSEDSRAEDLVATSKGFIDVSEARELIDDYSRRPAGSDPTALVAAMVKRIRLENPKKRCTNQVRKAIGDQLWADASYGSSTSSSKGEPSGFEDFQEWPSPDQGEGTRLRNAEGVNGVQGSPDGQLGSGRPGWSSEGGREGVKPEGAMDVIVEAEARTPDRWQAVARPGMMDTVTGFRGEQSARRESPFGGSTVKPTSEPREATKSSSKKTSRSRSTERVQIQTPENGRQLRGKGEGRPATPGHALRTSPAGEQLSQGSGVSADGVTMAHLSSVMSELSRLNTQLSALSPASWVSPVPHSTPSMVVSEMSGRGESGRALTAEDGTGSGNLGRRSTGESGGDRGYDFASTGASGGDRGSGKDGRGGSAENGGSDDGRRRGSSGAPGGDPSSSSSDTDSEGWKVQGSGKKARKKKGRRKQGKDREGMSCYLFVAIDGITHESQVEVCLEEENDDESCWDTPYSAMAAKEMNTMQVLHKRAEEDKFGGGTIGAGGFGGPVAKGASIFDAFKGPTKVAKQMKLPKVLHHLWVKTMILQRSGPGRDYAESMPDFEKLTITQIWRRFRRKFGPTHDQRMWSAIQASWNRPAIFIRYVLDQQPKGEEHVTAERMMYLLKKVMTRTAAGGAQEGPTDASVITQFVAIMPPTPLERIKAVFNVTQQNHIYDLKLKTFESQLGCVTPFPVKDLERMAIPAASRVHAAPSQSVDPPREEEEAMASLAASSMAQEAMARATEAETRRNLTASINAHTAMTEALLKTRDQQGDGKKPETGTRPPCWMHQKGTCTFGEKCRFSHGDPQGAEATDGRAAQGAPQAERWKQLNDEKAHCKELRCMRPQRFQTLPGGSGGRTVPVQGEEPAARGCK